MLAGTNPGQVTLARMLDVAHVLLVEAFQSVGMNLVEAIERVSVLGNEPLTAEGAVEPAARPPDEAANERSLVALEEMMKGVSLA